MPAESDRRATDAAQSTDSSVNNVAGSPADSVSTDPREAIIEHLPALRAFALSISRDASLADDLVQETLLKAWTKFHLFTPGTNLRAWLFTILRNSLHSLRRKRKREVADPDGIMAGQLATKPDHDGRLALSDLAAAFVKLPIEQREALLLVGAMGFSVEEAADTCGCAAGTIKSRAARGRRALADLLGLDRGEGMDLTEAATMAVMSMQGQKAG
ncbi:MAG: RNA polymerase sigma factor [Pararhodobacter sp.]